MLQVLISAEALTTLDQVKHGAADSKYQPGQVVPLHTETGNTDLTVLALHLLSHELHYRLMRCTVVCA